MMPTEADLSGAAFFVIPLFAAKLPWFHPIYITQFRETIGALGAR